MSAPGPAEAAYHHHVDACAPCGELDEAGCPEGSDLWRARWDELRATARRGYTREEWKAWKAEHATAVITKGAKDMPNQETALRWKEEEPPPPRHQARVGEWRMETRGGHWSVWHPSGGNRAGTEETEALARLRCWRVYRAMEALENACVEPLT